MIIQATEKNFKRVHYILTHKDVYPYIIDDYSSDKPDKNFGMDLLKNKSIKVLMPNKDCVFIVTPITMNIYSGHMNILPEGRGKKGVDAGKEVIQWMFDNTKCLSIIGITPKWHKTALIYSRLIGLKKIGIIEKSIKKNDILYDQIITSISKGVSR